MNAVLEFPPLETAAEVVEAPLVVASAALVELSAVYRGLADLAAEHGSTNYDITTPIGYRLATARRFAIRQVRFRVPKVVEALKAELKEAAAAVTAEAERIIRALRAIEDPHHALIEAEDARRAAIKAEQERIEAEKRAEAARIEAARVAEHESRLATIRRYLSHAEGLPSSRVALGIESLEAMQIDPAVWEEFADAAASVRAETLEAMRALHQRTKASEDAEAAAKAEAARLEALRIEQERIAAEQAERQRVLDEQAAELRRREEALAAEQRRLEEEAEEQAAIQTQQDAQAHGDGEQPAQAATENHDTEAAPGVVQGSPPDAESSAPSVPAVPTVTLGQIHKALGFNVGGAFIGTQFGLHAHPLPGKAVHYVREEALRMLDALAAHVIATKEKL